MEKNVTSNKGMKTSTRIHGISAIAVSGYKSLAEERRIAISPLTILAGANSSGKSSIMQPLLLLKQTLQESYDPGALLVSGPNIAFTSAEQLLSSEGPSENRGTFCIKIELAEKQALTIHFKKSVEKKGFDIEQMDFEDSEERFTLRIDMDHSTIAALLPKPIRRLPDMISNERKTPFRFVVARQRCFLAFYLKAASETAETEVPGSPIVAPASMFEPYIRKVIHVPASRGNPERLYPATAVGSEFPGTFEKYVASVIAQWQARRDEKIRLLNEYLKTLELTWKIDAKSVADTQVELRVGRLRTAGRSGTRTMVSIADVGFGVSQALPVLVALLVAEPGQLVFVEQPEIHLHPKATLKLSQLLTKAANRGVKVVVETHSRLLLRGIQTEVAKGNLSHDLVKLHWFSRRPSDGVTEVNSADLDQEGAFGEWPADFDETTMQAEREYLDA
jgi:predicted ATPase